MLDRLPYELVRRILDEAHPPFAASSSNSPSTTASRTRLRFLGGVERTCKNVQVAAHDLLWHSVWIRPVAASAKQLDRILTQGSGEGDLARVLNHERFEKPKNDEEVACVGLEVVTSAVGKMHKLVEISLRQNVKGGVVDLAGIFKRQCLRTLVLEGENLNLSLADWSFGALVLPKLRHMTLKGVVLSTGIIDNLLTVRHFPALKTIELERILVDRKPAFPKFEPELLQQLESINVALDEWAMYQPVLEAKAERVLAHVDRRICISIVRKLRADGLTELPSALHLSVKNLVLSTEDLVLENWPREEPVALAVHITGVLVYGGHVSTLFRPATLRNDLPTRWPPVEQGMAQRVKQAERMWTLLETASVHKGVEVHYLDKVADVKTWPTWAQDDPSLKRIPVVTQERDRLHDEDARRPRTYSVEECLSQMRMPSFR